METLILSNSELHSLVRHVGVDRLMSELIDRLATAFSAYDSAEIEIPSRTGFYYDDPTTGLIEWMPLFQRSGRVLMKMVGYHPANPNSRNLPTILSTFSTFDTETGHLTSLVDGTFLTALRTGAASAVASQLLASPDSRVLGLIGCGAQAITQLHALSRVFELRQILIYDIDRAVESSFANRAAGVLPHGASLRAASVDQLLAEADLLCVATAVDVGKGPVFDATETKPWLHVNAVGSDLPGKTELPLALLNSCFICADNPEQARLEGECQQLAADGVAVALSEIARHPELFTEVPTRRSIFDSTGWALEDQVVMDLVLEWAEELAIGTRTQVESIPSDPWNPYDFLQESLRLRSCT